MNVIIPTLKQVTWTHARRYCSLCQYHMYRSHPHYWLCSTCKDYINSIAHCIGYYGH